MSTRFRHIRALTTAVSLLLVASSPITAHGGEAYLPRVGPVPLRFAEKLTSNSIALIPNPVVAIETNAIVVVESNSLETNAAVAKAVSPFVTNRFETNSIVVSSRNDTDNPNAYSETEKPSYIPAETTPLTQEVLVEFFKPTESKAGGGAVGVTLPFETGFAPPSPKTTESSRAVYKSE